MSDRVDSNNVLKFPKKRRPPKLAPDNETVEEGEKTCDEVCCMPVPDRDYVLLVYYDSTGRPTFERRVPKGCDWNKHHLEMLRDGRAWTFQPLTLH